MARHGIARGLDLNAINAAMVGGSSVLSEDLETINECAATNIPSSYYSLDRVAILAILVRHKHSTLPYTTVHRFLLVPISTRRVC